MMKPETYAAKQRAKKAAAKKAREDRIRANVDALKAANVANNPGPRLKKSKPI